MSTNENKYGADDSELRSGLLASAKAGDQSAYAGLFEMYEPLIVSLSARFRMNGMTDQDFEELTQDARVEFCKAVVSYDPEYEGVEFGLYAKICISNALTSRVRRYITHKRKMPVIVDGEEMIGQMPSGEKNPIDEMIASENYMALCERVAKVLSAYENEIWWMSFAGQKVGDIAAKLGRDERSVTNAIYRIRKKLRESLGDMLK